MDKDYILREIVRTTIANGGTPPGIRTFKTETGIGEYDWKGKYWARWGDALVEAGFAPNVLTSAFSESFLIEKLIPLISKFGRLPVNGELRLFAHNEEKFPNPKAFQRLGSKKQWAEKIFQFCENKEGLENVSAVCATLISLTEKPNAIPANKADNVTIGYVYLLKSGSSYKIGKTNAVGRREYELGIQLPEEAAMIHKIPTDDPAGIEAYWHHRFKDKRLNGEWFKLDQVDIGIFKRRKYM